MAPCEETLAWLRLSRTPRLTVAALATALDRLGSACAVLDASDACLEAAGISAGARDYLRSDAAAPQPAERRWLEAPDHHLLPLSSPTFPPLLRASPACPVALYVAGRREALGEPQLAVVGSRHPTPQGMENAFELARGLARRGLAITSGLAQGIDAAAHRGALAAQGTTLAVLGCGADRVYPHTHADLSHAIRGDGALVSGGRPAAVCGTGLHRQPAEPRLSPAHQAWGDPGREFK
jgi:DNA processing protein